MNTPPIECAPARRLVVVAALLCAAAIPAPAFSADPDINPTAEPPVLKVTPSPTDFVRQAAEGGMAEVQLSQLAQERTADPDVRRFAARMITDHRKVEAELKSIAESKGIEWPKELAKVHRASLESLRRESERGFNDAYMALMKRHHLVAVSLYEAATRAGFTDTELKGFAIRTLPTLKEHLDRAREFPKPVRPQEPMRDGTATPEAPRGDTMR
jgi:putative membrane protein